MKLRQLPRREFLRTGVATTSAAIASAGWANGDLDARVMAVSGAISAGQLGVTLPHEHVLADFVGPDKISRERYDQNESLRRLNPGSLAVVPTTSRPQARAVPIVPKSDQQRPRL